MTVLNSLWTILNLLMFLVGILMIVIGGINREREHRVMYGEVIRQLLGARRRRGVRWAKAREQALLEDDMADIRAERERARR